MSFGPGELMAIVSILTGIVLAIVGTIIIVIFKGPASLSHAVVPFATLGFAAITLAGMAFIAKVTESRTSRVLWNCVFVGAILVAYFVAVQRSAVSLLWLAYAILLVIGVQAGALFFLHFRERTIKRLVRHYGDEDLFPELLLSQFKTRFERHSIVYAAFPVGAVLAAFGTMLEFWPPDEVRLATIGCIFGVVSLMLSVLLVRDTRELLFPGLTRDDITRVTLSNEAMVLLPPSTGRDPSDAEKRSVVDATVAATEIRTLFLFNQYQMFAVLVASVFVVLSVLDVQVLALWVGAILAIFAVVVSQLPFVLGQRLAHATALEPYSGIDREEVREKLDKFAGLFPAGKTWIALTGSGTVGAIANTLITKLLGA